MAHTLVILPMKSDSVLPAISLATERKVEVIRSLPTGVLHSEAR
jgi:hypothetical protein